MSIVKMKKMAVIGLDTVKEKLISDLMELGTVQVTEDEEETLRETGTSRDGGEDETAVTVAGLNEKISRVSLALDTLEKYNREKQPLFRARRPMKQEEFARALQDREKIERDVAHVLELNERIRRLREIINKKNSDLSSVTPWVTFDLPLETTETARTAINLGVLPSSADMEALYKRIYEGREAVMAKELGRDKDLIYLVVIMMKEDREEVLTILKQHGYTPTPFTGFKGTAAENRLRLIKEIEETEKASRDVEKEIGDFHKAASGIECLYDSLVIDRDREDIKRRLLKTKRTFTLTGWVPENCVEKVSEKLAEHGCYFVYRDPKEDENAPILLSNSSFAYPFESIIELYSLPDYRGVDPTKYLSLFYAMFFGLMLSDGGYGIVITLACYIALRKLSLEGMAYKMIKMFFYCGIATIFWGAMFGTWFGDSIPAAAELIFHKNITIPPIWFNPMDDPTKLLIWSLVFGVVHLFIGMGLKAAMLIRRGHPFDAFCDVFSWYMVIVGGVMWLAGGFVSDFLPNVGKIVTIAGFLVLLLTGGRHGKGFGKITGGLGSLYDVTGYISDILSYSRILALGLATGVIATVINTIGSILGGGIKGTIMFLFVFLLGHSFNLIINALGAFVHASRLHYVEFFSKFYEDGGDEFVPFRKNTKYIKLVSDIDGGKK